MLPKEADDDDAMAFSDSHDSDEEAKEVYQV